MEISGEAQAHVLILLTKARVILEAVANNERLGKHKRLGIAKRISSIAHDVRMLNTEPKEKQSMVMTIGKVSKAEDEKLYPETMYNGSNGHDVFKALWPDGEVKKLPLEPSLTLANHSPTGFSWGYWGSGPSQLALALLLDATSVPETALAYYQEFKRAIVAGWGAKWVIFRSDIINWLRLRHGENIKIGKN